MKKITLEIQELEDNVIEVKTDYMSIITLASPYIPYIEKKLEKLGYTLNREAFDKAQGHWLHFKLSPLGTPRTFYFRRKENE